MANNNPSQHHCGLHLKFYLLPINQLRGNEKLVFRLLGWSSIAGCAYGSVVGHRTWSYIYNFRLFVVFCPLFPQFRLPNSISIPGTSIWLASTPLLSCIFYACIHTYIHNRFASDHFRYLPNTTNTLAFLISPAVGFREFLISLISALSNPWLLKIAFGSKGRLNYIPTNWRCTKHRKHAHKAELLSFPHIHLSILHIFPHHHPVKMEYCCQLFSSFYG